MRSASDGALSGSRSSPIDPALRRVIRAFAIEEALEVHKQNPQSRQLEIETYTWDVLPVEFKTGDIVDYV